MLCVIGLPFFIAITGSTFSDDTETGRRGSEFYNI